MAVVREAVISEGPYWRVRDLFRAEVSFHGDRVIAIMHTALSHGSDKLTRLKLPTEMAGVLPSTLAVRRQHLMRYVQKELGAAHSLPEALSRAFEKMNKHLLKDFPDITGFPNGLWQCQYNTLVVVVDQAQVFVAGTAAVSQAMLVRNGQRKMLTRLGHSAVTARLRCRGPVKQTPLCFLNEENLTRDDKYLVVFSPKVLTTVYSRYRLPAVLQTRVEFLGLETACAQIVDPYRDAQRLLIVMPLDVGEDKVPRTGVSVKELGSYGTVSDSSEEEDEDEDESGGSGEEQEEYEHIMSRLSFLAPLVGRGPDIEWRGSGRTSIRLVSPGKVVCKFMSTTLVINMGDIAHWEVTGKKAAVVIPEMGLVYQGLLEALQSKDVEALLQRGCKVPVIVNRWTNDLAEGYKAAVSKAQGYQCIAFPAVGCGGYRRSPWEVATIAVDTMISCGGNFEEVHFVINQDDVWRAWVAATDLLTYTDKKVRGY